MDGTLIDTKLANFLSYKKAIEIIMENNDNLMYDPDERFNRDTLKKICPNLNLNKYNQIIQTKERLYIKYLSKTKLNKKIANILSKYNETNVIVLVTNCRKKRVIATLKYHNLVDRFNYKFFNTLTNNKNTNKYKNVINLLNFLPINIIVFENEKSEIRKAISAGILEKNIIKVKF